ncbi:hypothetical protein BDZ94DRAFT_1305289 [Collybia nuda]|uniref:C2H2-type domain-containing protein n=1 Tax=Collybia nuda TaxID=64659 RepID=A0A9P5YF03_9AGAR|nr:hypothetical protein BDZ94DRAFT_1305289 [Collybia nuda]
MATSKPIALPSIPISGSSSANNDYTMGSYSADANGNFNPASYTRHFLGSPISWRAGSFGSRFPQGSPTVQLLSSIDPNEFRHTKMSSSIDSDRGSLFNAWNVFDMDAELCRNYNCCGLQLNDLHALLEHFEEVHILVAEPGPPQIQVPFNPQPINPQIASHQHNQNNQQTHQNHMRHQQQPFDTDDMELELDLDNSTHPTPAATSSSSPSSGGPSPPHTPVSAPLSAYSSPSGGSSTLSYLQPQSQFAGHSQQYTQYQTTPYASAHASPYASEPPSPGSTPAIQNGTNGTTHPAVHMHPHLSQAGHYQSNGPNVLTHPEEAFNSYARFAADYSSHMPGTQFNGSNGEEIVVGQNNVVASSEYGVGVVNGTVGEYGQYIGQMNGITGQGQQGQQCIPPALLFASTGEREAPREGREGSEGARVPSPPMSNSAKLKLKVRGGASASDPNTRASSSASTPAPTPAPVTVPTPSHTPAPVPQSSLLLSKPFRCPKPNCNKSYKQANGLKYHMTHGSCNFAPPKDLEHVKDLLERKRREREANAINSGGTVSAAGGAALSRSASLGSLGSGAAGSSSATNGAGGEPFLQNSHSAYGDLGSITETELREVEREAERRVRPFACGVGDCQRRYKNMNGLRYHYQHSGDHGAVGLALLAGGLHECLSGNNGTVGGSGEGKGKGKGMGGIDEREGRRRPLHRTAGAGGIRGGSASVPVSRAGSVVGASRVGTPVGYASGTATPYTSTTGATTPFSPGATTPFTPAATTPFSPSYTNGIVANNNTTPPLTPLTAAVQGLGLGGGNGAQNQGQPRSQPHSPTANGAQMYAQQQQGSPQMQQQQQHPTGAQQHQLAYQAQFAELQRRSYMQAQAQAQAQVQAQQQQQQAFGHQQDAFHHQQEYVDAHVQAQQAQAQQHLVDAQAQRDFVEAQRAQAHHAQQQRDFQQRQFGSVDMTMS